MNGPSMQKNLSKGCAGRRSGQNTMGSHIDIALKSPRFAIQSHRPSNAGSEIDEGILRSIADEMPEAPTQELFGGSGNSSATTRGRANGHTPLSDFDCSTRTSYYGRRLYPTFNPALAHACPLRFVRQFEHAATHNGLPLRAWAQRFNACLQGKAEDWAFDEVPVETAEGQWDMRKRQFLDWAVLPAEQELRRQRLLRFYQGSSDLSIDFVYTFEEVARGLREFREDVWARKCVANMLPPLRAALIELWPSGLPTRFRDLRDSLYAADWDLYESASGVLRPVKCGTPYVYEVCVPSTKTQPSVGSSARTSVGSSAREPRVGGESPDKPTGVMHIVNAIMRMSERERILLMEKLERLSMSDIASQPSPVSRGLLGASSTEGSCKTPNGRVSAELAESSTKFGVESSSRIGTGRRSREASNQSGLARPSVGAVSEDTKSGQELAHNQGGDQVCCSEGKIRLHTRRPLTTMTCAARRSASGRSTNGSATASPRAAANGIDSCRDETECCESAALRSRRSDSALTSATRSIPAADAMFYRESMDNIKSPEFTVLPQNQIHTRRSRFRFIKKISNMLSH